MRDWDITDKLRLIIGKRDIREALALVRLREAKAVEQRQQRLEHDEQPKPPSDAEGRERAERARRCC